MTAERDRPMFLFTAGAPESASTTAEILYPFGQDVDGAGEATVERMNQFSFYEMGRKIRHLYDLFGSADEDVNARLIFSPLHQVRGVMAKLLTGDPMPISVSRQRAEALLATITSMIDSSFYTKDENGERKFSYPDENTLITPWLFGSIRSDIEQFETVFSDEMGEAATYYVPRRGIYWTPGLVDLADEAFPTEIRGHVPQKARDDWKAAGRCLAFSLLTASGFHAVRAVEGILEAYYQLFAGKPGKTLRGWDDYIKALTKIAEGATEPKPSAKTLSELDQMRTFDRNPIMHPRVVLSESDARIIFGSSESLIIAMAQEIKLVVDAGGIQTGLSLISGDTSSAA